MQEDAVGLRFGLRERVYVDFAVVVDCFEQGWGVAT